MGINRSKEALSINNNPKRAGLVAAAVLTLAGIGLGIRQAYKAIADAINNPPIVITNDGAPISPQESSGYSPSFSKTATTSSAATSELVQKKETAYNEGQKARCNDLLNTSDTGEMYEVFNRVHSNSFIPSKKDIFSQTSALQIVVQECNYFESQVIEILRRASGEGSGQASNILMNHLHDVCLEKVTREEAADTIIHCEELPLKTPQDRCLERVGGVQEERCLPLDDDDKQTCLNEMSVQFQECRKLDDDQPTKDSCIVGAYIRISGDLIHKREKVFDCMEETATNTGIDLKDVYSKVIAVDKGLLENLKDPTKSDRTQEDILLDRSVMGNIIHDMYLKIPPHVLDAEFGVSSYEGLRVKYDLPAKEHIPSGGSGVRAN